jgi:hypothetical protein
MGPAKPNPLVEKKFKNAQAELLRAERCYQSLVEERDTSYEAGLSLGKGWNAAKCSKVRNSPQKTAAVNKAQAEYKGIRETYRDANAQAAEAEKTLNAAKAKVEKFRGEYEDFLKAKRRAEAGRKAQQERYKKESEERQRRW